MCFDGMVSGAIAEQEIRNLSVATIWRSAEYIRTKIEVMHLKSSEYFCI